VIGSTARLEEFNRWYAATQLRGRTYLEALVVFAALWRHASHMNEGFPGDWQADIAADVELARVLNGCRGGR
jgi:hypothetical protein